MIDCRNHHLRSKHDRNGLFQLVSVILGGESLFGPCLRLFADLGGNQPFGIGISMKYTTHQLNTPVAVDGGYVSSFVDWSVKLSRPFMGVDLDLIYSNSNLSGSDCSAYSGHNSQCDGLVTLKAARAFY